MYPVLKCFIINIHFCKIQSNARASWKQLISFSCAIMYSWNRFVTWIYSYNFILRTNVIMKDSFLIKASGIFYVNANSSKYILMFWISKGGNSLHFYKICRFNIQWLKKLIICLENDFRRKCSSLLLLLLWQ